MAKILINEGWMFMWCEAPVVSRRILALADDPEDAMSESDWIETTSGDGMSLVAAAIRVQEMVDDGTLVVLREEPLP